jgi:2-polyprenyl-3-methyl-5-hydroxy-6-metoxy-1,4-benzoquinol methylase
MASFQQLEKQGFDGFRQLAAATGLSRYERIGFPNTYREGHEENICREILAKLSNLQHRGITFLDIGPGCSDLPHLLLEHSEGQGHRVLVCDSAEMLAHLPVKPSIQRHVGRFPEECSELLESYAGRVDAILAYSVIHYVFAEGSIFRFLDACLQLLAPGGQLLLGDIPNISKRKRFFASEAGKRFHRQFTGSDTNPEVAFNQLEPNQIDDTLLLALMSRARSSGFDAYLLPQSYQLPMANRREDLLICRP